FRSWFCPVHKNELKLFLPLVLIFFFICFNYNVLRAAKDALVVTAPSSGAEIIPFMKVWVILPMALLMTVLFTRLANKYTTEKVFYIMMAIFLGFFAFFSFVVYPFRDTLHPHQFADHLESILPLGMKGFVALIRNWTYTAFYVMSELWGTTIMTVLFWGFANEILDVKTAKRFYVLILIGGNLSAICAGGVGTLISSIARSWTVESITDPWQYSLMLISSIVIISGLLVIGLFKWLFKNVFQNPQFKDQLLKNNPNSSVKMGLRKNFKYLASSKYLLCIATIVLTYNICSNLTEVTWKDQLLHLCPQPNDFNSYMNKVTMWVGIVATTIAIITSMTIRKFSWTWNAMVPPTLLLITGAGFFAFLLTKNTYVGIAIATFFGSTPHVIGVLFGSMQQSISRGSKYTIFDATKELAFIPLNKESKLKGKAAIDGIGSRLGKSGSAIIYQALLMFVGTVAATLPYVAFIMLFVIAAWMVAVSYLGKQFQSLVAHNEAAEMQEVLAETQPIKAAN
ncbi:MAG: Npt1/Npt2 family nucleotide transporter, partial [Rhabdochlamydiaceae bacterium]